MADAVGALFASWFGYNPSFLGDLPRAIFTASGTVDPASRFVVANSATAITLTLPSGTRDGQPMIIKAIGGGGATVNLTLDGTANTAEALSNLGALRLIWSAQLNTWLSV